MVLGKGKMLPAVSSIAGLGKTFHDVAILGLCTAEATNKCFKAGLEILFLRGFMAGAEDVPSCEYNRVGCALASAESPGSTELTVAELRLLDW